MKYYGIAYKFLALLLCACALLTGVAGAIGVYAVADQGLYTYSVDELHYQSTYRELTGLAENLATRYVMENLSNCPEGFINAYAGSYYLTQLLAPKQWYYTIEDGTGKTLQSTYIAIGASTTRYEFVIAPEYPVILSPNAPATNPEQEDFQDDADNSFDPMGTSDVTNPQYFQWEDSTGKHSYQIGMQTGPAYLLTLHLAEGAYTADDELQWQLLEAGYRHRFGLLIIVVLALLLFAIGVVYLCCAAGKNPSSDEILPQGMNRMPLDLYYLLGAGGGVGCYYLIKGLSWWTFQQRHFLPGISIMLLCGFVDCLLICGAIFATAAQSKLPAGYGWRHCISVLLFRGLRRLMRRGLRKAKEPLIRLFQLLRELYSLLPMTWQWLVTAGFMGILLIIATLLRNPTFFSVSLLICAVVVLYRIYCFGTLLDGARRMSKGNLNTKIPLSLLMGSFREMGEHLNALDDAAVIAAKKQMQSERMKAELVTNVSHDLKTPLTSIINYVDLLQGADSPEQTAEYLDVLSRQSQRMKKLIDDLVEMNKASTGNMSVDLIQMDAAETINQALGEFSDKLESRQLQAIFQPPAEPVTMLADGRLTWRVLSNLLSNAVKYALPGTRLYVDLHRLDGFVVISLKNISRQQLNLDADELLERFVRGDLSRNTEGSGLGLNIAKSLMELQQGQLQLLVDGDLFKVTLFFLAQ